MWAERGYLLVRGALPPGYDASTLSRMADEAAALPAGSCYPWLVHHERSRLDGRVRICRVENYCKHHDAWGSVALGHVAGLVGQAFGERAVLFKDKINFKGPGGGGFLAHQDATAYATEDLAQRHISVRLAIDAADEGNGPLEVPVGPGTHTRGIYPNLRGVLSPDLEGQLGPWAKVLVEPGDLLLFDSFLPHRSSPNESSRWRRSAYLTYNKAVEGDFHAAYYQKKLQVWSEGKEATGSISINDDFGGEVVQPPA